eukprot:CAMPEP_0113673832 /NCGR_PEP_ID=MMETSP0038_2-20120614/7070_1 /TAXON_ID=2898 /ORGANISM="Cryptomonas paramecium" /LENGTH=139 /DNA_ID=CAMNT_0000590321 /DNA_START=17 /DNA_END=436 /DNA_ORIENTATION=+ /assembly_acc=CAM_ASM_000170
MSEAEFQAENDDGKELNEHSPSAQRPRDNRSEPADVGHDNQLRPKCVYRKPSFPFFSSQDGAPSRQVVANDLDWVSTPRRYSSSTTDVPCKYFLDPSVTRARRASLRPKEVLRQADRPRTSFIATLLHPGAKSRRIFPN